MADLFNPFDDAKVRLFAHTANIFAHFVTKCARFLTCVKNDGVKSHIQLFQVIGGGLVVLEVFVGQSAHHLLPHQREDMEQFHPGVRYVEPCLLTDYQYI